MQYINESIHDKTETILGLRFKVNGFADNRKD